MYFWLLLKNEIITLNAPPAKVKRRAGSEAECRIFITSV
jgi:hypothetical protein